MKSKPKTESQWSQSDSTPFRRSQCSKKCRAALLLTLISLSLLSVGDAFAQDATPPTPAAGSTSPADATPAADTASPATGSAEATSQPTSAPTPGDVTSSVTEVSETVEIAPVVPPEAVEAARAPMQVKAEAAKEEAPVVAAAAAATAPPTQEKKWYDYISLSPSLALWLPIDLDNPKVLRPEVFFAVLKINAEYGPFQLVLEPSFRQTKNRRFYPSNVVLRQAYLRWNTPVEGLSLSGGLLFNQFGFFWDGSFFGNNTVYVGRKLNADYNLQVEWDANFSDSFNLHSWFQLSPGTDGVNITLFDWWKPPTKTAIDFESGLVYDKQGNSYQDYKQGIAARFRTMPKISFGDFYVIPALSLEFLTAVRFDDKDRQKPLPARKVVGKGGVFSTAVDLSVGFKKLRFTSEFVLQSVSPGLVDGGQERVNRYHISNSIFAPVYFNPQRDWFKVFIATAGFSYSKFATEDFNEYLYQIGLLTQVYEHVKTRIEYGRYWSDSKKVKKPNYAHQLEFLLHVDF